MWKILVVSVLVVLSLRQDTEAIMITCPTNVTSNNYVGFTSGIIQVRTDHEANVATVTWDPPIVTENVSRFNVTSSPYKSGDEIPISTIHVITFTATESSGDTDTCNFVISVIDIEDPICTIDPPTYIGSAEMDEQNSTINYVITVRDNV
ncbi:sushi, von Willebrand factor type A, EGF and pentraxin domain-containing protein 1-like [Anneissia japonica]|uniref:sushi, von Willebrand factor type A, EGF and pentraxin domain-containing protein 1-like n=1 Tax=Anneissia japonica TaxID=1529436 RepID=UPI001425777B|nr:sushi, von Willebrand factor type A, EGF and pentraxin domain-containing protein 1-like [Anneissia japonica]